MESYLDAGLRIAMFMVVMLVCVSKLPVLQLRFAKIVTFRSLKNGRLAPRDPALLVPACPWGVLAENLESRSRFVFSCSAATDWWRKVRHGTGIFFRACDSKFSVQTPRHYPRTALAKSGDAYRPIAVLVSPLAGAECV